MRDDVPASAPVKQSRQRRGLRALAWMAIGALGATSLIALAAVTMLPWLDDDPSWAARWLSEQLHHEVELDRLELAMEGLSPVLRLGGVRIRSGSDTGTDALRLSQVKVELSALGSLRSGALRPQHIRIVGAEVALERRDDTLLVKGVGQAASRPVGQMVRAALASLPADSELSLEDAEVTIARARDRSPAVLRPVSVRLRATERRVALSARLGQSTDESLRVELSWPPGASPERSMALRVTARRFEMSELSALLPATTAKRVEGRLTLDIDGEVRHARVVAARGALEAEGVALAHAGTAIEAAAPDSPRLSLSALIDFNRSATGWRLLLPRLVAGERIDSVSASRAQLVVGEDGRARFGVDSIAGRDLLHVAKALWPRARPRLALLASAGRVDDLEMVLGEDPLAAKIEHLSAELRGVRLAAAPARLSLSPLDARLEMSDLGGAVHVHRLAITLPPPRVGEPRTLNAAGELRFGIDDDGLSLFANGLSLSDGPHTGTVQGRVRWWSKPKQLVSDLTLDAPSLPSGMLVSYLGATVAGERLDRWLREAVRDGTLRDVELAMLGTISATTDIASTLNANARFADLTIDYQRRWPALTNLEGTVSLNGARLAFDIDSGRIAGNAIRGSNVLIEDITSGTPWVRVRGTVVGSIEKGANFVRQSPLASRFEELFRQLEARGPSRLQLALDIPIEAGDTRVRGTLNMKDNVIAMPALRSDLEAVSGSIAFDESGVVDGKLDARYLDQPIAAELEGASSDGLHTRLTITGRTTRGGLLRHLYGIGVLDSPSEQLLPMLSRLDGETGWRVSIGIPTYDNPDRALDLAVRSDLRGMSLGLPAPLGKVSATARPFEVSTRLDGSAERRFQIRYGDDTRARVEVRRDGGSYRATRAGVRFGGEPARLPTKGGVEIAGHLSELPLDQWLGVIAEIGHAANAPAVFANATTIAVSTDQLRTVGLALGKASLALAAAAGATIELDVSGPRVAGRIEIPQPLERAPVRARFERLLAPRADEQPSADRRPLASLRAHRLPAVDATVDVLGYGDLRLGRAELVLRPASDGVRIERLALEHDHYAIDGDGKWSKSAGRDRTELALKLRGDELGRTLQAFGYSDSGVTGATVEVELNGYWPGSPFAFSLEAMTGELDLRTGRGRFVDVEPGAPGRVFGLLSVTLLPRRLFLLDFSDLFGEGLGFRRISGRFSVEDGHAYTNTLTMDADTAEVSLDGRIGLAAQDYEQVMTVAPKLSSSLPLAPLWLAEKVLNKKLIDPAFARRYRISGSWDEPEVERIEQELATEPESPAER